MSCYDFESTKACLVLESVNILGQIHLKDLLILEQFKEEMSGSGVIFVNIEGLCEVVERLWILQEVVNCEEILGPFQIRMGFFKCRIEACFG